jgi:hypothetical protein
MVGVGCRCQVFVCLRGSFVCLGGCLVGRAVAFRGFVAAL